MEYKAKKYLGQKINNNFIRAKKSLGQNFLKSIPALNKIIEAGEILPTDIILEIGPGKGALTKKLLEKAGKVIAVEKDNELFEFLKIKFEKEIKSKKLILINEDILKFKINNYITPNKILSDSPRKFSAENFLCPSPFRNVLPAHLLLPRARSKAFCSPLKFKIIANIPYNITGAILKKFLTDKNQPTLMVLMVQNEVAKRIIGNNPSTSLKARESILSISVKAYGEPKIVMKVPARYFSPAPKVDSAIICIKNISRDLFIKSVQSSTLHTFLHTFEIEKAKKFEEQFWEIIHSGFAHKRKKLSNNLRNFREGLSFTELKNKRAEELTLDDWINLIKVININRKQ